MAKQEQHLTTARLSAYIDGQLSLEEQTQTEAHLQNCAVCQQQLTELRQTVALLHALPQPPLPRSFVLPTAEPAVAASHSPNTVRPLAPITPLPRRRGWPTYVAGAVRAVSTLAALVGIVFLLSGLFGTVIPNGSTTSSGGGISSSGGASPTQPLNTPHITRQGATPSSVKGQTVTGPSSHGQTPVQQNPFQTFLTFFNPSTVWARAILGVVLLVLGIIGFVMVRRFFLRPIYKKRLVF